MIFNNLKSLTIPEGEVASVMCNGIVLWEKQALPFEYQAVEYIESTGTQYIDTGVKLSSNFSVEIDYQITEKTQNRCGIFGGLNLGATARYGSLLSPSNNYLEHGYGATNIYYQTGLPDTNRHLFRQEKNLLYVDGDLIHTFTNESFNATVNAYLGNFNFTNYKPAKARYYGSKWWNGDTIVRNFIPCYRKADGEVGLYDTVTKSFFTNAGTGEFVCDKPKYKIELSYLESTGTQHIDTGIVGNQNTAYEIEASSSYNGNGYMVLFGSRQSANSKVISTLMQSGINIVSDFGNYQTTRQTYSPINKDVRYRIYNSKDNRNVYSYETGKAVVVTTKYTGSFLTPTNLHIGHKTSGFTDAMTNFVGKVFGCKVWQDSVLVRNFIPVLDWNNVPCMYDKVSGELFYNQGTGQFLYK